MKKLIVLTFILFTTTAFAQAYTVERVIDGDTLKLTNGEIVELIGMDAPEASLTTKQRGMLKGQGKILRRL